MTSAADFKQAFLARTRAARKACGMSQADIARALGISRAADWTYERRTTLPHHLLEEFANRWHPAAPEWGRQC
jgi:transcriptional regulator with XRE-family HTH domain